MVRSCKLVRHFVCVLIIVQCLLVGRHYFGPMCQGVENSVFSHDETIAVPM